MGIQEVITEVAHWPSEQRLELVRELNRITAAERIGSLARRVAARSADAPLDDEQIDLALAEVRKERPLHQR